MKRLWIVLLFLLVHLASPDTQASGPLTLKSFLDSVVANNQGYQSAREASLGAEERSGEADLQTLPTFFAQSQWVRDERLPQNLQLVYRSIESDTYTLGISQQFAFGLKTTLSGNAAYTGFNDLQFFTGTALSSPFSQSFWDVYPKIEASFPLLSGGFGKTVRAQQEATRAQALAAHYSSRFTERVTLAEAESTYWRLALARHSVRIQTDAKERAQKISDWARRRSRLSLADETDTYQAEAALKLRTLELQAALDEERSASRSFNNARQIDSDVVSESLESLDKPALISTIESQTLGDLLNSSGTPVRDDIRAYQESQRSAEAAAVIGKERNRPSLDLFGSYAWNGRGSTFGNTLADPFRSDRETQVFGIKFTLPLAVGTWTDAVAGYERERLAAEKATDRKQYELQKTWEDLTRKLAESKKRLSLAQGIESLQKDKLEHERTRFQKGRSTTYQVLMFEQDFSQSQLQRARTQTEVLNLIAQLKLFRVNP